jgi:tetratricopeptide (TPR) repeat protein
VKKRLWPRTLPLALAGLLAAGGPAPARTQAAVEAQSFNEIVARAEAARDAGNLQGFIDLLRQALDQEADWAEGHWMLGSALYELDRHREARDAFRRVTTLEPESGVALAMKGLCEFQLEHYEVALSDLQKARVLGLHQNAELHRVVLYHVAILMNRMEQYEVAREVLKPFAARGVESPAIIEALGLSMLRLPFLPSEVPPEKREMIRMAGRALSMMMQGKRSVGALNAFEELVLRYPGEPNVHYALGYYLAGQDPARAAEELKRELRRSPTHHAAMIELTFVLMTLGRFDEAVKYGEGAVDLAPNLFAARNALGRALLEQGEVERAIEQLEAGARLAPDSPDMYFALSRAYRKAGREEDATRALTRFEELNRALRALREGGPPASTQGVPGSSPPEGR